MSDQWLCLIDGRKLGPLTFTRLQQLAETGRLKPDDYVRRANDEQWLAARNVPNLIPSPSISVDRAETSVPGPKLPKTGVLPVRQAIGNSAVAAGIPRGKAVLAKPASENAIASPPAAGTPFMITQAKAGQSDDGSLRGMRKRQSGMPLTLAGAVVVGGLAIMLILVLSGVIDVSGRATPVADANPERARAKTPNFKFDGEETNPDEVETKKKEQARQKGTVKRQTKQESALLSSVKQFRDITKLKNIKLSPVQISVTGLWLSANEQGEPYVAGKEGNTEKGAFFLVIKLQIDNAPGAAPMTYRGWADQAVLFDDASRAIQPLLPLAKERVAMQRIEAGGSLVDTLVFPLQSVDFEKLRLVLPHETVGIKDKNSFGLELPRQALGRGLENQLVNTVTPPVAAQVAGDKEPAEVLPKVTAPMPPAQADTAKPKANDELGLNKLETRARELDKIEQKK
jgi:hypothetical protein